MGEQYTAQLSSNISYHFLFFKRQRPITRAIPPDSLDCVFSLLFD